VLGVLTKKEYHFVKWEWIYKPKKKGGLGMKDLFKFNINLMYKWWWKVHNGSGPWQNLMKQKYLRDGDVFYTKKDLGLSLVDRYDASQTDLFEWEKNAGG
jgi:hypothetical protein